MGCSNRHINVERRGDVFCVQMRSRELHELDIHEMADELTSLVDSEGCRKLALSLGPGNLNCLYSLFLSKLVTLRRRLLEKDGRLKLCDVVPATLDVFEACQLKEYFEFEPDLDTAAANLAG
jgi:anti-anti-sigma factor